MQLVGRRGKAVVTASTCDAQLMESSRSQAESAKGKAPQVLVFE
jgi:hypothetical protein